MKDKHYFSGIEEINLHGMTVYQAEITIDSRLKKAGREVYRLRLIHGYHGGTAIRDMVRERYTRHPKVIRIEFGLNAGETDLILREL